MDRLVVREEINCQKLEFLEEKCHYLGKYGAWSEICETNHLKTKWLLEG